MRCPASATVSLLHFGSSESGRANMGQSRLYPSVDDQAPFEDTLTSYDERHLLIYADLLETEADGGDWDEAALLVLRIDPVQEPVRARRVWENHLTRARWLAEHGYRHLLGAQVAN
jgi:hypothetical protein